MSKMIYCNEAGFCELQKVADGIEFRQLIPFDGIEVLVDPNVASTRGADAGIVAGPRLEAHMPIAVPVPAFAGMTEQSASDAFLAMIRFAG